MKVEQSALMLNRTYQKFLQEANPKMIGPQQHQSSPTER